MTIEYNVKNLIEVRGIGHKLNELNQEFNIQTETFKFKLNHILTDLEEIIEASHEMTANERVNFLEIISMIRENIKEETELNKLEKMAKQMKGLRNDLSIRGRLNTLIVFLILIYYWQGGFKVFQENNIFKIKLTQKVKTNKFILYDLSEGSEKPLELVGSGIIKHLLQLDYSPQLGEKVLICNTRVNCQEQCKSREGLYNRIISDFTDVEVYEKRHPVFFNGLRKKHNITCGKCLAIIYEYEKAGEILEVINQDELESFVNAYFQNDEHFIAKTFSNQDIIWDIYKPEIDYKEHLTELSLFQDFFDTGNVDSNINQNKFKVNLTQDLNNEKLEELIFTKEFIDLEEEEMESVVLDWLTEVDNDV